MFNLLQSSKLPTRVLRLTISTTVNLSLYSEYPNEISGDERSAVLTFGHD